MPGARSPIALIYNPASGFRLRRRRTIEQVVSALESCGARVERFPTREPHDGFQRGEEAARRFPTVAILGGDGTANEVINGMVAAGSAARVLLLPGGSVNVLARDLGIPLDPLRAALLLRDGTERRVYLGRAGDRYFALMAGTGFDAAIVRQLAGTRFKRTVGPLAFVVETVRCVRRYAFPTLAVDNGTEVIHGYMAVVGNSPGYAGWFSLTPGADLGQPGFQVAVITGRGMLSYLSLLGRAFRGSFLSATGVVSFAATCVRISSEVPVQVQVDGEPHGELPMEFISDGTSLPFLVPDQCHRAIAEATA